MIKKRSTTISLCISLLLVVESSILTIYFHASELSWIDEKRRDVSQKPFRLQTGLGISDGQWLPDGFSWSSQHRLAIEAASTCMVASAVIAGSYFLGRRSKQANDAYSLNVPLTKSPTGPTKLQFLVAALVLAPALVITTFALVHNYVEGAQAIGIHPCLLLKQCTLAQIQASDGRNLKYMNLESWTCSVRSFVIEPGPREAMSSICGKARAGRWMLVPLLLFLLATAVLSWVAFGDLNDGEGYQRLRNPRRQSDNERFLTETQTEVHIIPIEDEIAEDKYGRTEDWIRSGLESR